MAFYGIRLSHIFKIPSILIEKPSISNEKQYLSHIEMRGFFRSEFQKQFISSKIPSDCMFLSCHVRVSE